VSLCPPRWHARRKARSKTDSHVPASTSIGRLAAATVGEGSRLGRKNRAKARKTNGTSDNGENDGVRMLRKRYRGRAIVTAQVGVGRLVGRIRGGGACSHALCREWMARRRRHEGREKRSRMANEVAATEARTIIIVRRYRWSNGLFLAGRLGARPI
jgi:hypothetical protein